MRCEEKVFFFTILKVRQNTEYSVEKKWLKFAKSFKISTAKHETPQKVTKTRSVNFVNKSVDYG